MSFCPLSPIQRHNVLQRQAYIASLVREATVRDIHHARALVQGIIAEAARHSRSANPAVNLRPFVDTRRRALEELNCSVLYYKVPVQEALEGVLSRLSSMALFSYSSSCLGSMEVSTTSYGELSPVFHQTSSKENTTTVENQHHYPLVICS